ncbi:hypothetical protein K437DRAFT_89851 [Tilletiaria anomala UBC 951]|uniref:Uncharacterized protein n=1 Tax=Tilletiaria anomala (strain ATCC 24038 / CBS 436.72 / UBC 951) TaxID=1037660 RepID=A0A066W5Y7_TILAU|nr:uncharacterized protein K437DRAFT_89851 [Tilletiaria anomala UBC 951]KDN47948.1 hypothetical protein K437DRAFT_89851 [Tilletiaria anomala UBC 951]
MIHRSAGNAHGAAMLGAVPSHAMEHLPASGHQQHTPEKQRHYPLVSPSRWKSFPRPSSRGQSSVPPTPSFSEQQQLVQNHCPASTAPPSLSTSTSTSTSHPFSITASRRRNRHRLSVTRFSISGGSYGAGVPASGPHGSSAEEVTTSPVPDFESMLVNDDLVIRAELDDATYVSPSPSQQTPVGIIMATSVVQTEEYVDNASLRSDLQQSHRSRMEMRADVRHHQPVPLEKLTVAQMVIHDAGWQPDLSREKALPQTREPSLGPPQHQNHQQSTQAQSLQRRELSSLLAAAPVRLGGTEMSTSMGFTLDALDRMTEDDAARRHEKSSMVGKARKLFGRQSPHFAGAGGGEGGGVASAAEAARAAVSTPDLHGLLSGAFLPDDKGNGSILQEQAPAARSASRTSNLFKIPPSVITERNDQHVYVPALAVSPGSTSSSPQFMHSPQQFTAASVSSLSLSKGSHQHAPQFTAQQCPSMQGARRQYANDLTSTNTVSSDGVSDWVMLSFDALSETGSSLWPHAHQRSQLQMYKVGRIESDSTSSMPIGFGAAAYQPSSSQGHYVAGWRSDAESDFLHFSRPQPPPSYVPHAHKEVAERTEMRGAAGTGGSNAGNAGAHSAGPASGPDSKPELSKRGGRLRKIKSSLGLKISSDKSAVEDEARAPDASLFRALPARVETPMGADGSRDKHRERSRTLVGKYPTRNKSVESLRQLSQRQQASAYFGNFPYSSKSAGAEAHLRAEDGEAKEQQISPTSPALTPQSVPAGRSASRSTMASSDHSMAIPAGSSVDSFRIAGHNCVLHSPRDSSYSTSAYPSEAHQRGSAAATAASSPHAGYLSLSVTEDDGKEIITSPIVFTGTNGSGMSYYPPSRSHSTSRSRRQRMEVNDDEPRMPSVQHDSPEMDLQPLPPPAAALVGAPFAGLLSSVHSTKKQPNDAGVALRPVSDRDAAIRNELFHERMGSEELSQRWKVINETTTHQTSTTRAALAALEGCAWRRTSMSVSHIPSNWDQDLLETRSTLMSITAFRSSARARVRMTLLSCETHAAKTGTMESKGGFVLVDSDGYVMYVLKKSKGILSGRTKIVAHRGFADGVSAVEGEADLDHSKHTEMANASIPKACLDAVSHVKLPRI